VPDKETHEEQAEGLSEEELADQDSELLEDREVMTILPINPTAPAKFLPPIPLEPPP
jgi:hypothetical protein